MENKKKHIIVKYIVVGDSGVGKSSLIKQFTTNKYDENYDMTIGVEFAMYTYIKNDIPIKMQIWDTAGQERFKSITRSFYRGANCALLVFDLSNKSSFDHIKNWIDEVDNFSCGQNKYTHTHIVRMMLVGNKCDIKKRQISYEEASDFAKENRIDYIETSVVNAINIKEAFLTLIDKYAIIENIEIYNKTININKKNDSVKSNLCLC